MVLLRRIHHNATCVVVIGFVFCSTVLGQGMIADITLDVATEFGTYRPYLADFSPNAPEYTVEPDLSNVVNYSDVAWRLGAADSIFLLQNHFTVKKSQYKQLYDIYNESTWNATPIFVTTDAVLHIYHVLYDGLLSEIEVQKFVETLALLTETLIDSTASLHSQSKKPETREALLHNLAFLSVGKKLLKGADASVPEIVSAFVDSELVLISDHDGFHCSPVLGPFSELDYSQFQPRGHYTRNDTLEAYFQTMMWYGWTIFTMEPELFGELASRHTLQALLLVQMLYALESNGSTQVELWGSIYESTVFFVGKTDDPNVRDYRNIADMIYGSDFLSLPPDSLADASLLESFMTEAQKLPEPAIPNWIYGTFLTYKGFRFMGQRFIPDSYMFARLVLPEVEGRLFPKGLDVMAILGSERAYTLLDSLYEETSYPNYSPRMTEFKTEFSNKPPEEWAQNLYWNWLYCLMPLLYTKGAGYPFFMRTLAWADKELLTALASWAELRHDTILYAKQSMSPCGIPPGPPKSYVEPNPHLYARLASLVRYTREGLHSRDLLLEEFREKLELFETLLLFLRDISIKELENIPLSATEYENIFCFGRLLEFLVSDSQDPQHLWDANTEDMAVVADVHTDSNTDQCLEEGVGYPLEIFVIVHEGGITRITQGAIFSYYEFPQPIAERLTDETWREMLTGDAPPPMPEWVSSFMDVEASQPAFAQQSPDNLYHHEFTSVGTDEIHAIPGEIRLVQNYPNPFNSETMIRFDLVGDSHVKLVIYNILGQKIRVLWNEQCISGTHTVRWDGRDSSGQTLPSGVYLVRVEAEAYVQTNRMVLLK